MRVLLLRALLLCAGLGLAPRRFRLDPRLARRDGGAGQDADARMPVDEGPASAPEFARRARAAAPPRAEPAALTPLQRQVLLEKSTEPAGHAARPGGLDFALERDYGTKYPQDGAYRCVGCGARLYWARQKVGCGCGWPAFYDCVAGAVDEVPDATATYDPADRFDGARVEAARRRRPRAGVPSRGTRPPL
jgi:peptide methionine sulfoxide reductase MsrB